MRENGQCNLYFSFWDVLNDLRKIYDDNSFGFENDIEVGLKKKLNSNI